MQIVEISMLIMDEMVFPSISTDGLFDPDNNKFYKMIEKGSFITFSQKASTWLHCLSNNVKRDSTKCYLYP